MSRPKAMASVGCHARSIASALSMTVLIRAESAPLSDNACVYQLRAQAAKQWRSKDVPNWLWDALNEERYVNEFFQGETVFNGLVKVAKRCYVHRENQKRGR